MAGLNRVYLEAGESCIDVVARLDDLVLAIHMHVSIDTDNKHPRQLNHTVTKPLQGI